MSILSWLRNTFNPPARSGNWIPTIITKGAAFKRMKRAERQASWAAKMGMHPFIVNGYEAEASRYRDLLEEMMTLGKDTATLSAWRYDDEAKQ